VILRASRLVKIRARIGLGWVGLGWVFQNCIGLDWVGFLKKSIGSGVGLGHNLINPLGFFLAYISIIYLF